LRKSLRAVLIQGRRLVKFQYSQQSDRYLSYVSSIQHTCDGSAPGVGCLTSETHFQLHPKDITMVILVLLHHCGVCLNRLYFVWFHCHKD